MARLPRVVSLVVAIAWSAGPIGCGKTPANDGAPPIVWHSLAEGERLARRQHKPALLFFFAEWSMADKELDQVTFPDPAVRAALADFVAIRVDCTDDEDKETMRAKERFHILGVPSIVAVDSFETRANELFRFNEYVRPEKLAATVLEGARYVEGLHVDPARYTRRAPGLVPPPEIRWRSQSPEPRDRPALVFVHDPADARCTRVMRDTFGDPVVRRIVDDSFVAVDVPDPRAERPCSITVEPKKMDLPYWNYRSDGPILPTPLAERLEDARRGS